MPIDLLKEPRDLLDAKKPKVSGTILPFSRDSSGAYFDSNAGVFGMAKGLFSAVKDAVTLPGDVMAGRADPNDLATIDRAIGAGVLATPVGVGTRAGLGFMGAISPRARQKPIPPTAEELKAAASAGYQQARDLGVDYSANAVSRMASTLKAGLENDGFLPELAPKTFKLLKRFEDPPEGAIAQLSGLDAARRAFGQAAKDFNNPTEQLAARRLIEGIDDFIAAANPKTVLAGDAAAARDIITTARGNYAAGKRSERIGEAKGLAISRGESSHSGFSFDNPIRQTIRSLLNSRKKSAGFSDEEIAALKGVIKGTRPRNAARRIGNLFGGGGGLGSFAARAVGGGAGAAVGGVPGAAVGAVASGAIGRGGREIANALAKRSLNNADELVRSRAPLAKETAAIAPFIETNPDARAAIVRALVLSDRR